jgi:antitoxin component YwqK of YwqJK toxin-antitoxin module
MLKWLLLFVLLGTATVISAQQKVIQKKFDDGSPHVIGYYSEFFLKKVLVKQEVYYENGNLEYSGEWKFGKEHGEWIYYHENGKEKAHEYWSNGKEDGVWKEYDEKGKLLKEITYKNGKLIKTTKH